MQRIWKPEEKLCINCGKKLVGNENSKGLVKYHCSRCGLVMISRKISRRHEKIDVVSSKFNNCPNERHNRSDD